MWITFSGIFLELNTDIYLYCLLFLAKVIQFLTISRMNTKEYKENSVEEVCTSGSWFMANRDQIGLR
jgi:hypothetical protein